MSSNLVSAPLQQEMHAQADLIQASLEVTERFRQRLNLVGGFVV